MSQSSLMRMIERLKHGRLRPCDPAKAGNNLGGIKMDVSRNLEPKIDELIKTVQESTAATRVTNALLLGQALGVSDITKPVELARVVRYLEVVERGAKND